jgi:hypothetical protein
MGCTESVYLMQLNACRDSDLAVQKNYDKDKAIATPASNLGVTNSQWSPLGTR